MVAALSFFKKKTDKGEKREEEKFRFSYLDFWVEILERTDCESRLGAMQ